MGQQIVAAAVDGLLGYDVVSRLGQGLNGVGDGRSTRCQGQRRHAALQSCDALFQHVLGGVCEPTVDVAGIRQAEPGGGVGGVVEHVRSGLVDRHCPGIGGGVGLLLTHVKL